MIFDRRNLMSSGWSPTECLEPILKTSFPQSAPKIEFMRAGRAGQITEKLSDKS